VIKKVKLKYLLTCLVIVGLVGVACLFGHEDILRDDYYMAINEDILMEEHIKDGEYTWSTFTESQEKSDEVIEKLVDEMMTNGNSLIDSDTRNNMKIVYQNALDMNSRNQLGIKPLKKYLNLVFQSKNVNELIDNVILVENELGVDIFTSMVIEADYINQKRQIVYFYPMMFPFGVSVDYFVDPDYMTYQAYLKRGMVQLFQLYGYDKTTARKLAKEQVEIYEKIGDHSKMSEEFVDIKNYYQIIKKEDLMKQFSHLDIKNYLEKKGVLDEEYYSVVDLEQYQFIDSLLTDDYLEFWKHFILVRILGDYAIYSDSSYSKVIEDLNQDLMGIDDNTGTIEDKARDIVVSFFQTEFDLIYQKQVMTSEKEEYIEELVEEIRGSFLRILEENDWLDSKTKMFAKEKIEKMKLMIGEDYNFHLLGQNYDCDSFQEGGSLIENVISAQKVQRIYELGRLDSDQKNDAISQSVVNAYYSPLDNSIYIPASVAFLFDINGDYYENLGSIGMVIAHEMTHGFDSNGSQFDEEGNLHDWWTDEDKRQYEKLKKEVEEYYSNFEVLNGKYINGNLTVNENIADLGAIACLVELAEHKGASKHSYQQMFSSFAKFWVSQEKEEYLELLLLEDNHAPNQYRVNAVLSSTDKFYEVYDINVWNGMYISSDERVRVW